MKRTAVIVSVVLLVFGAAVWAKKGEPKNTKTAAAMPIALLDGGRRIDFLRFVTSEQDVHQKRGLFSKIIDVIAGAPQWRRVVRPYSITTDSQRRLLITDPGSMSVHIFDFDKNKYLQIEGGKRDTFHSPIGVTVDDKDNLFVTDSELGKIFVFDSRGKFLRMLGELKGGEGFYKRPTGIAYDRVSHHLYVTDTLRNKIFIIDENGTVVKDFGRRGSEVGEFNFPTEIVIHGDDVYVVDAMNFRVQRFDREGNFEASFGTIGQQHGNFYRPKGLAVDSENHVYLVDASLESVQVFDSIGRFLYSFGETGTLPAEFQLPSGIWIDKDDRIYVADSYNHRVQVLQFVGPSAKGTGGQP